MHVLIYILLIVGFPRDTFSDKFINHIMTLQTSWKAGHTVISDLPRSYVTRLMGVYPGSKLHRPPPKLQAVNSNTVIPKQFDPRQQWPMCPTLFEIRDQGSCSSCWALAAVEVMSDRVCIHSNGTKNFHFSAEDLISCCRECGSCNGGWPVAAWKHWVHNGIVSGGPFNSSQGCLPYAVPPCLHSGNSSHSSCDGQAPIINPLCYRRCAPGYDRSYKEDLHFGSSYYSVNSSMEEIQWELLKNGPVESTFIVFEDFLYYKSGIYKHVAGKILGTHAVKIMGWGVEKGMPYWLVANSWNTDWGEGGMFRILRQNDECGLQDEVIAGLPKLRQY